MDKPNAGARGPAPANPGVIAASGDPVNALRDPRDRRIPRVAGPCVLVMFGVTGDLARKKLMPASTTWPTAACCRPASPWSASPAGTGSDEDFAQITYQAVKEHARTPFRDDGLAAAGRGRPVRPRRVPTTPRSTSSAETVRRAGRDAVPAATTRSTCPSRRSSSHGGEQLKRIRPVRAGPRWRRTGGKPWRRVVDREAVRPRPADARKSSTHRGRGVPRRLGVPHRPLSGQGDRPEHPGAALRQHHCTSRYGTAATWTTCRSPCRRTSGSAAGPAITTGSARRVTSSRTTCCSCSR